MRTKILTESKTENAANAIKHIFGNENKLECLSAVKTFQPTPRLQNISESKHPSLFCPIVGDENFFKTFLTVIDSVEKS